MDTSAWVAFLRGDAAAIRYVNPLLAEDAVCICGPIYAELLSGTPDRVAHDRLRTRLRSLRWIEQQGEVWDRVAQTRFTLARLGYQVSLVDVMIAHTAVEAGAGLLTQDRDFQHIGLVLPLNLVVF